MQRLVHIFSGILILWLGLTNVGSQSLPDGGAAHTASAMQPEQASLRALALVASPATATIFLSQKAAASIRVTLLHLDQHLAAYYAAVEKQKEQDDEQTNGTDPEPTEPTEPADDRPVVYLTFDDGPSKYTPEVLDILDEHGIKATFFVLGEHARANPDTLIRIAEDGHAIGNHSYNHRYNELYGEGFASFAEQVLQTNQLIYEITGVHTLLFRAPGGTFTNFDLSYWDAMEAAGYIVHDWNVDSGDSRRKDVPAKEIVQGVKDSRLGQRLSVLLHDSGSHEQSVKALPEIIAYYEEAGYRFASLTEDDAPIQFRRSDEMKWKREKADQKTVVAFIEKTEQLTALALQKKESELGLSLR